VTATTATASTPPAAVPARRRAALIAGVSTLLLAAVGMPANLITLQLADAAAAGGALAWAEGSALALRAAVLAIVVASALDIVIAWALTRLLERPGDELPRLAGWLRVAYAAAFLVSSGILATGIGAADEATIAAASTGFGSVWSIALVLFAAHLLTLGLALLRSPRIPRLLGALILAAGGSYAVDGVARILVPELGPADGVLTTAVAITSIVGEIGLALWLLARGGRR